MDANQIKVFYNSNGVYALKTYRKTTEEHYINEVQAYRRFCSLPDSGSNIIQFWGNFIYGDTFNLLLEFADRGDLSQFIETVPPPQDSDINLFWNKIFEILRAIATVHGESINETGTSLGYHG